MDINIAVGQQRKCSRSGEREIVRQVHGAGSYLSMNDPRVLLGLGDIQALDELEVCWFGGETQSLDPAALPLDGWYRLVEGEAPETFTPGERSWAP